MTCTGRRSGTSSLKFKLAASLITMPESWMIAALKLSNGRNLQRSVSRRQKLWKREEFLSFFHGVLRGAVVTATCLRAVADNELPCFIGRHARTATHTACLDHSLHLYRVDDHSCTRTVLPQRQTSALAPPSCHQPALDHHLSTTFLSRSLTQHGTGEYHHPHCPDDDAAMTPPLQYHLLTSPTTAYTHDIGEYHHPHTDVDGHSCHQPAL